MAKESYTLTVMFKVPTVFDEKNAQTIRDKAATRPAAALAFLDALLDRDNPEYPYRQVKATMQFDNLEDTRDVLKLLQEHPRVKDIRVD